MWALVEESQVTQKLLNPVPFVAGGVQYDVTTFFEKTTQELKDLGVYPLVIKRANPMFYDVLGFQYRLDEEEGIVYEEDVTEARNLHNVKQELKQEVMQRASNILSSTDWYVVRALETTGARPIKNDLMQYRESVRVYSDERVGDVDNIETLEEAQAFELDRGWPAYVPNESPYSRAAITASTEERIREVMRRREMYNRYIQRQQGSDQEPGEPHKQE